MLSESISSHFFQLLKRITKSRVKSGLSFFSILQLRNQRKGSKSLVSFFSRQVKYSDANAFLHSVEELFVEEVYSFKSKNESPYIIDCGANIGLSVYYFKKQYPSATILAFEPDPQIFSILKYNVEEVWQFNDVKLENKAVWYEESSMDFYSDGALAGSMVVNFGHQQSKPTKVPVIDLRPYLKDKPVDFLKIDIEGAENDLLPKLRGNLGLVDHLFLEYHSLTSEPQFLSEILSVLKTEGFRFYIKEAAALSVKPFLQRSNGVFDLQLNMFFRK